MFEKFLKEIKEYVEVTSHIESAILVGSYARGDYGKNSDIDIVIITSNKSEMILDQSFILKFGEVLKSQIEYYGACTSIRVWYKDGKEVEFGIVNPSWIQSPLDVGTRNVLEDGYKVIVDKKAYFKDINL